MKIYKSKIIGEMQALMEEVTRVKSKAQGTSGKKETNKLESCILKCAANRLVKIAMQNVFRCGVQLYYHGIHAPIDELL